MRTDRDAPPHTRASILSALIAAHAERQIFAQQHPGWRIDDDGHLQRSTT